MNRLLLVEDEEVILRALARLLERNNYEVTTATSVAEAAEAQPQTFDLVVADLRLPGAEGTDMIALADPVPVVIMTSHASVRSAVTAMQKGAIDYISKPFDHDELLLVLQRALLQNRLKHQNQALFHDMERLLPVDVVMNHEGLAELLATLQGKATLPNLLSFHGEPGAGRERLVRALFNASDLHDLPVVFFDAGNLAEREYLPRLFGGEAAIKLGLPATGLLQSAHSGVLVIRHPERMPSAVQDQLANLFSADHGFGGLARNSLLGAHEEGGAARQQAAGSRPPGGRSNQHKRLICISNMGLDDLVAAGRIVPGLAALFEDQAFEVPPLRADRHAIPEMAARLARHSAAQHQRQRVTLNEAAMAAIVSYDWPGNLTELACVIQRAVLICQGREIDVADLGLLPVATTRDSEDIAPGAAPTLSLDGYFRYFVLRHQGALSETEIANRLGISRKSLWERRQKMQLLRPA